ncbi:cysteine--tRNA ligase [candidate division WWE3 bacterium RIFCSPHIGHO2_12_FULL_38_15]|uniref:Cysteine--tRNA ligase n=1 Tax=candidate division WWE3 bacterium RIFCSPHIGHO2_02_FULL_38_14 TaxID=1802620 RepID=A0A1F4V8P2_UNCKA|nr:MAG: cysteine--tRNA ligase [candidate division WWE3 bacterium RIFCSPHIGHO2_01_FULL_38_45]OGC48876.1 MAG: cysteine--tRNA ligase [candidate division WWE3 bacterium RIFCSPHIGHO2_12_FULL_38_15]OGC53023.1 MAG: cysteine--tRNA ligase [candidate division WWE3 bacterium RIFCSPHIGHO2_02_FULL_38_14]OGC53179.1 MAG: cysteine--tRNA ligase [candidate division WWE3 bacterium RIFCSPLOWO2_01_FULL_37_24]HLB52024.1 cysteine--tRNA ligase [Patescibacteria group bacterium]
MPFKLYNSMSKSLEDFEPINPNLVTIYFCGPTVYDFATIGNFKTYTLGDVLVRALKFNGFKVKYIMNLTDVGHLTGDNLGDADLGEDRIELAAEKEGRSARDIANFYIEQFLREYEKLNLIKPLKFIRATDYINPMIELIKVLERKGFTYKINDGIYFDTSKYSKYGELSGLTAESIMEGARVEPNPLKKNPNDFALWKFSPQDKIRWQEWDSPWGKGFPGWHIECSAMILKELGETIDVHGGGEDLKMIHHQNEIAQSECSSGKQFVKYWVHGAHLQVDGGRMGKSLGNAYTVSDIESKSFDPLSLRYFYLSAHYRSKLNFTWEALQNAQNSVKKLYDIIGSYEEGGEGRIEEPFLFKFVEAINDDLNMPKALAVAWDLLKSDFPESSKIMTLLKFDEVFGFKLENHVGYEIPQKVQDLAKMRNEYRKAGIWDKADQIRKEVEALGFVIEDKPNGQFKIKRKL